MNKQATQLHRQGMAVLYYRSKTRFSATILTFSHMLTNLDDIWQGPTVVQNTLEFIFTTISAWVTPGQRIKIPKMN